MKIENKTTYSALVKNFVIKICRMRLHLLRTGKSQINDNGAYDLATGLQNDAQLIYVDVQAAKFLRRHAADILALMPGKNCKCIEKLTREFNEINWQSQKILSTT